MVEIGTAVHHDDRTSIADLAHEQSGRSARHEALTGSGLPREPTPRATIPVGVSAMRTGLPVGEVVLRVDELDPRTPWGDKDRLAVRFEIERVGGVGARPRALDLVPVAVHHRRAGAQRLRLRPAPAGLAA